MWLAPEPSCDQIHWLLQSISQFFWKWIFQIAELYGTGNILYLFSGLHVRIRWHDFSKCHQSKFSKGLEFKQCTLLPYYCGNGLIFFLMQGIYFSSESFGLNKTRIFPLIFPYGRPESLVISCFTSNSWLPNRTNQKYSLLWWIQVSWGPGLTWTWSALNFRILWFQQMCLESLHASWALASGVPQGQPSSLDIWPFPAPFYGGKEQSAVGCRRASIVYKHFRKCFSHFLRSSVVHFCTLSVWRTSELIEMLQTACLCMT